MLFIFSILRLSIAFPPFVHKSGTLLCTGFFGGCMSPAVLYWFYVTYANCASTEQLRLMFKNISREEVLCLKK